MQKLKKTLAIVLAVAMTTAMFTGCNGNKPQGTSKADKNGNREITFMTWESQTMNDQILASFKKFEESHKGVTIKLTPAPLADYGTKIKQMISSGNAPDVFMVGNNWVIQYGSTGNIYDWTELAKKDNNEKMYYPGVVDNWKVNGKQYGFPGLLNTYGMFYNKALIKEAGLTDPKNGWTYQDMVNMAKTMTKDANGSHTYGLYTSSRFDPFFMSTYAKSAGDLPFAEKIKDNTKVQASPKFKESVGIVSDAIKAGYITNNEFNVENAATMFMEGKIPMLSAGQWFADEFIRNAPKTLDWGFVAWPVADAAKPAAIYDSTGWASSKDIQDPELIYEVIKFIHTETYAKVLPQTPVAPAAAVDFSKPYYDKLISSGHQEMVDAMKWMLESPDKLPVRFFDTFATNADKFISDSWGPIINGTAEPDALDKMVDNINKQITKEISK